MLVISATPEAKRGLFIGVFVMALNQFSGIFAILTYAGTILQMSGTGIDPNVALVLVAILNICGNLTSFAIIDRAGRKIMLLLSATGVGLALAVLGAHSYLLTIGYDLQGAEWLPVLALALTLFLGAIGITNIPFFIVPEVMPPKVRGRIILDRFISNFTYFIPFCSFVASEVLSAGHFFACLRSSP